MLATSDLFAPGLALGHGIGRLGCFAAGCCWGKPTPLPWAVTFNNPNATTGVPLGIPLHPTQLYEAFAEGICLILVAQLRRRIATGRSSGCIWLLYGFVRFAVEFLREHDASNPLGGPLRWNNGFRWPLRPRGFMSLRRTAESVQPHPRTV